MINFYTAFLEVHLLGGSDFFFIFGEVKLQVKHLVVFKRQSIAKNKLQRLCIVSERCFNSLKYIITQKHWEAFMTEINEDSILHWEEFMKEKQRKVRANVDSMLDYIILILKFNYKFLKTLYPQRTMPKFVSFYIFCSLRYALSSMEKQWKTLILLGLVLE